MPKVAYPVWQHLAPFLEGVGAQEFLDHHWDAAQLFVKKPWFEKGFSFLGGHSSIAWGGPRDGRTVGWREALTTAAIKFSFRSALAKHGKIPPQSTPRR